MNITNNFYYDWPLVTLIGNSHEPQWVEDILARVRELDQQELNDIDALNLLTEFMIFVAWEEMVRN